jgi:hypothetical protein
MTVYVDELRVWPTKIRCFKGGSAHLTADTETELHAFAKKLRLSRSWFQPKSHPHYDLTPKNLDRAILLGALAVPAKEQARRRIAGRLAEKAFCDCYDDGVGCVLGPGCQKHRRDPEGLAQ